ncbi:MAG TPA: RagB/SusD family nutrient uptake outer membrane protein [Kofleriaceae bacterium]|nr:RagB/SusD family nutrient uptake outer membrane protein [Kofleriaceae bacterium]
MSVAACNIDVPDLNNPGLGDLKNNPNANVDNTAATGMLITSRLDIAGEAGFIDLVGILGREAYNFDAADGRYVTEIIEGTLNKSDAYGGAFWLNEYRTVQLGNIILAGLDQVNDFSTDPTETANDKAAMKGFVETIQALGFLLLVNTHYDTGAPVEIPTDPNKLAPFVSKDQVFAKIAQLLDDANTLLAPLAAMPDPWPFTFPLSPGYDGFDDTAGFQKFNRALRARVAVYTKDYPTAVSLLSGTDTFIEDSATADFANGVYHSYSLTANDATNGLVNKNIWAHPSLRADAQKKANGDLDDRFTKKVVARAAGGSSNGLSSSDQFTIYGPTSFVSIIRNEDLILLKAEALAETGDLAAATTTLNHVRVGSGGLEPIAQPATLDAFITALLYEREYSMMMEGHRWIDLRRLTGKLPLDRPTDMANLRFPVPQVECDARGNEPACSLVPTAPLQ